jgi:hypothetical protein
MPELKIRRSKLLAILAPAGSLALLLCAPPASTRAWAQSPLSGTGGAVNIVNSDLAVLETQEVRDELPCTVTPVMPVLGFDLRFHAGYGVSVPLKELSGSQNHLTVLFRVTPANRDPKNKRDELHYFVQTFQVPSIEEDARGAATLDGEIDIGEGKYHVDWLMRDRDERVCSSYWDLDASLAAKDKQIEVAIAPGQVDKTQADQFDQEPPVARNETPLKIKVLVNFAPQNFDSAALQPIDTVALVSILRRISREPQFGKFSVVAFNMQQQRVLYRQSSEDHIDFPALGEAINSVKLGTVRLGQLSEKHGYTDFLADLIKTEMATEEHPDALIFAGPKIMLDEAVSQETLKPVATDVDYPVFYMNYNLNPQLAPWRDSISRAVRVFKGTEYTITRPRDLWFSFSEMVSRIVRLKRTGNTQVSAQ